MKQAIVIPQLSMRDREPSRVDAIIGKKRKSVNEGEPIDFSQCQLAKAYPNIADFLEEVYQQRMRQKAGGKLAHTAAIRPAQPVPHIKTRDPAPWEDGPSVSDARRAYETTHRGR